MSDLRFVMRKGEKILQQLTEVLEFQNGILVACGKEWRDVPVVDESNVGKSDE